MDKQIKMVEDAHRLYKAPVGGKPQITERKNLRVDLIEEELEELKEAFEADNLIEVTDALCDLLYVTFGCIIECGLQKVIEECFAEVHRSNMSKADENGEIIMRKDGKVLKGPNYAPPILGGILKIG